MELLLVSSVGTYLPAAVLFLCNVLFIPLSVSFRLKSRIHSSSPCCTVRFWSPAKFTGSCSLLDSQAVKQFCWRTPFPTTAIAPGLWTSLRAETGFLLVCQSGVQRFSGCIQSNERCSELKGSALVTGVECRLHVLSFACWALCAWLSTTDFPWYLPLQSWLVFCLDPVGPWDKRMF